MKLTKTHIEELYKFTRKHFVEHYDVQTELVDHLANDIEEIWVTQQHLSFQEARDKSFKKFGIFGFMDVVEAKQKQMNKRYWKIIIRFVKEWFTVPKIVTTSIIFLFFFVTLQIKFSEYFLLGILTLLIIYDIINFSIKRKKFKIRKKKKKKIFLLESMIGNTRNSFTGLTLMNLLNIVNLTKFEFSNLEIHWVILISAGSTLLCITFYIILIIIPQRAEELLQETYPEYKLVNNL
jgi:ABC-type multidrug transport system fused ATPase/permease subunit